MSRRCSCYFEPNLAGIFISAIILTGAYIYSLSQSVNMQQLVCKQIPNITISKDILSLHEIVADAIGRSHKNVQISFSDFNLTCFEQIYIPSLVKARSNGAKIQMILSLNDEIIRILNENGFSQYFDINIANKSISSQSIIADDIAFIAPFVLPNSHDDVDATAQLLSISNCDALVADISNFMNFYEKLQTKNLPKVMSRNLIAQSSLIWPLKIASDDGKSSSHVFMFHNPPNFVNPFRIDTNKILKSLFDEDQISLDIYSYSPQCLTSFIDPLPDEFSLYLALKALLMRNVTKVRNLVSHESLQEETEPCFEAFAAYSNYEVRTYNASFKGPNYIISHNDNSDESFIFAQYIRALELGNSVGLHYATDDTKTAEYLLNNFNSVWNNSDEINVNWENSV